MPRELPDMCPDCGLVILYGAIYDAAARADEFGPILGLSRGVNPQVAQAGYVGMSSLWLGDVPDAQWMYRCPRCKRDLLHAAGE